MPELPEPPGVCRLNFRLNKNCQKDVQALCNNLCSQTDGNVSAGAREGSVCVCLTACTRLEWGPGLPLHIH